MAEGYLKYLFNKDLLENAFNNEILTICLILFLTVLVIYLTVLKKKYNLPPGPTGVPILGYLPFLGEEPYRELDRLKKIYGNVFSLYMGRTYVVILGDYEAVKDAFSKSATAGRPKELFDFLPDGMAMASSNGEEWTEQRRFCVKSMRDLGVGKNKWEAMIEVEVEDFIKLVSSFNGQALDINDILTSSISNNISHFVLGKQLPSNHPDRILLDQALDDVMQSLTQSSVYIYFPILRDIAVALGIGEPARVHKSLKEFNHFFRRQAGKLKETYKSGEHDNFIVDYLKEMDNNKQKSGHYFNETNMYGNIQALFTAGSDTARASIRWLLLMMANFPEIQEKIHHELDSVIGKNSQVQWADRKKVPYTYATIMEAQRWKTIVPLNTARIAMEDIKVQNYDIPKGTTIIANYWGLHNDRNYWKEPEKFDPERFLANDGQVILKPDSYNPFSYGKRSCPGETIALMEILMYFSALMLKFTVTVPEGRKLSMKGILRLTYQADRQELHFIRREQGNVANSAKA